MPKLHSLFLSPWYGEFGPQGSPPEIPAGFQAWGDSLQCLWPHCPIINSVMTSGVDASAGHYPGSLLRTQSLPKKKKKSVLSPGHSINKNNRHPHKLLCPSGRRTFGGPFFSPAWDVRWSFQGRIYFGEPHPRKFCTHETYTARKAALKLQ